MQKTLWVSLIAVVAVVSLFVAASAFAEPDDWDLTLTGLLLNRMQDYDNPFDQAIAYPPGAQPGDLPFLGYCVAPFQEDENSPWEQQTQLWRPAEGEGEGEGILSEVSSLTAPDNYVFAVDFDMAIRGDGVAVMVGEYWQTIYPDTINRYLVVMPQSVTNTYNLDVDPPSSPVLADLVSSNDNVPQKPWDNVQACSGLPPNLDDVHVIWVPQKRTDDHNEETHDDYYMGLFYYNVTTTSVTRVPIITGTNGWLANTEVSEMRIAKTSIPEEERGFIACAWAEHDPYEDLIKMVVIEVNGSSPIVGTVQTVTSTSTAMLVLDGLAYPASGDGLAVLYSA